VVFDQISVAASRLIMKGRLTQGSQSLALGLILTAASQLLLSSEKQISKPC